MKRIFTYGGHLAVAVVLTQLPTILRADCIPAGADGDTVPFTLVTLKNTQVASYATGTLTLTNVDPPFSLSHSRTLAGKQIPQLFSDRTDPDCPGKGICLTQQPFDINHADNLGVSVTEATTFVLGKGDTTSITVTLTLESWGNSKVSFTGACNAANELYGTYDSNTSALIAFGTPAPPPPPPPK